MASAVLFERQPFDRDRSMADGREGALDRVGRAQVLPVLGGEVVEGEQHVAILRQAFDRLVVLRAVDFHESIEGGLGVLPGLGHPDVLQCPLGLCLAGSSAAC